LKFIAQLPEAKHYKRLPHDSKILFLDKATPLLEVESPVANPWNQEWLMVLGIKKGGNPNVTVAGKLRLKLFEPTSEDRTDFPLRLIVRSTAYGKFDYSPRSSLYHVGIPLDIINPEQFDRGEIPTYKWLQYDLYKTS